MGVVAVKVIEAEAEAEEDTALGTEGAVIISLATIMGGQRELPIVGRKKKRKTNTLGLTPGMESETEDDEGEEEALVKLLGQEKFQVDDVAEFIAERKRNYPTKARREAKKAAEAAQKNEEKRTSLERQADKLRRQLRKVESSIKRKREQGDEGDEMRDPSSDESSDDEKPEEVSSRPSASNSVPAPAAQPGKRADVTRHCKYFSTGGTCGKKSKCRFVHDPAVRDAAIKEREANNGRLTIQQRLILNDKEQEDLTILASIQYLRVKGVMTKAVEEESQKKTVAPVPVPGSSKSLLPAAPPSLPPPPVKREPVGRSKPPPSIIPNANSISAQGLKHYQGWLLKPYGSSSTKTSQSENLP
ncbi:unnamed protein product [Clonostachys chloroleuca]|uniref:C3H1-type domain-containing protein n=1 Tax=Clonostachys chloroleuca TaxID=1926264 RepID=A0AA35PW14_9HYPO|nr:unnamed protein product [Clonostachys chloroleuca]